MAHTTTHFSESQHFRQLWLWLVLIATALLPAAIFGYGLYTQLVLSRPFGNNPMSDSGLILTAIGVFALDLGLLALFAWAHLRTEVRDDGLYLRFFPFHLSFHRLPLADLAQVEALTYRPIMDYGGWGIRYGLGKNGKAYNVSGNRGVRLTYTTGNHLLLGSQHPDQLAAAIEAIRESDAGK